ncbi:MAG: DEAD/DEAH box helicase [Desulfurococcaceae archaeon]
MITKDPFVLNIMDRLREILNTELVYPVHIHVEEYGEPEKGPCVEDTDLPDELKKILINNGIRYLYSFQWEAYRKIISGRNVVIVAGTGTGKTEAFLLPIFKYIYSRKKSNPEAILVYPTKALSRDQLKRIHNYLGYGLFNASVYDGDTSRKIRERIVNNPPDIIITNPDMINLGLVFSQHIRNFINKSRFFVFDELHVYEGVLGSHVKYVIERIKRFKKNNDYVFIGSSATIGNPKEFAETLFGTEVDVVKGPYRRRGKAVHVAITTGGLSRWSVSAALAKTLAEQGFKFIIFADSQQMAEVAARIISKNYGLEVYVHRAGLPAETRRMVEMKLRDGLINGVVATPTLELGIDIGYLDSVILVSPPPTYAKYLQRSGRAGRRGRVGYIFMILGDDPIDAYYERNPSRFYEQEIPPSYIEPLNEEVLKIHLIALLLQESRIHVRDIQPYWKRVLNSLQYQRLIVQTGSYIYPNYRLARIYFKEYGRIRGTGPLIDILDETTGEIIGNRELPQALLDLHPGAVYYSFGKPYLSTRIDLDEMKAYVKPLPDTVSYYTRPLYTVELVDLYEIRERISDRGIPLTYAHVKLDFIVEGYVVKQYGESEDKGQRKLLNNPITYRFETKAVIVKYPLLFDNWGLIEYAEAFHAIEHSIISATRPVCGASIWDMGGISYPNGRIVYYDGVVGGSGLSLLLFNRYEKAEDIAYEILSKCDCEDGCPRCIYSPFCGNNNQILSRLKAFKILYSVLKGEAKYVEKQVEITYSKPIV